MMAAGACTWSDQSPLEGSVDLQWWYPFHIAMVQMADCQRVQALGEGDGCIVGYQWVEEDQHLVMLTHQNSGIRWVPVALVSLDRQLT